MIEPKFPQLMRTKNIRKISWEEYDREIRNLHYLISESYEKFSAVIPIKRGGYCIALHLSHLLGIPIIEFNSNKNKDKLYLVVDEVSDKGTELIKVTKKLQFKKIPYKTATLHIKEGTKFKPDFWCCSFSNNTWIIYPWEE